MADNTTLNAGSGGDVIASDDIGGIKHQRVKIEYGTDGSATDVSDSNPLPVDDAGGSLTVDAPVGTPVFVRLSDGSSAISALPITDNSGSLTVDGTVSVTNITGTVSLPTGAATAAKQPALGTAGSASADVITVQGVASMTPLQVADNGGSLTVDGTVAATQSGDWTVRAADGIGNALTSKSVGAERAISVAIVDGSGNHVTSFGGTGGTSSSDDADFTAGSTAGTPVMGVYESSASSVTDGDMGVVGITAQRALKVAVVSGSSSGTEATHDSAAASSGPQVMAVGSSSAPTAVSANGDAVRLWATTAGSLHVTNDANSGVDIGDVDVLSVTPGTGATNLGKAEDAAHASGDVGVMALTVRQDTAAALGGTNADYQPLITDASGRLHVNVGALPASTNTIEVVGDAATDAAVSGNPVYIAGRGNNSTPTAMSAANDVTPFWLTLTGAQVVAGDTVDDAAFTPGTSRVQAVGYTADETSTDSVDEGDLGAARMTLDRKQITTPYAHAGAGGATPYYNLDVDESEDDVKTSAGKVFWVHAMNLSNAKRYLKFYNATAASVTVGTTTPVLVLPIPTNADTNGCGFTIHFGDVGVQFSTAICIAATTGFADNDTGAPGANEIIVNLGYV